MQMIADGKIKEGTKIKIVGRFCCEKEYYFLNKGNFEIYRGNNERYDENRWTGYVSLYDLTHYSFEILEDTTEEIEEITEYVNYLENQNLIKMAKKINELVRAVNKLNKITTYKAENCMTD